MLQKKALYLVIVLFRLHTNVTLISNINIFILTKINKVKLAGGVVLRLNCFQTKGTTACIMDYYPLNAVEPAY